MIFTRTPWACIGVLLAGCGPSPFPVGPDDAGSTIDAGAPPDAGLPDAGQPDAGLFDAGVPACTVAPVTLTHTVATNANPLLEHLVNATTSPEARCNDGTPAAYILRAGVGGGAKRWILFLEGGGSCGSAAECEARVTTDPGLMTSHGYTEGATHTAPDFNGFKSADPTENPDFYDANLVLFHYCSSDQWSGDRDATTTTGVGRFAFKGRSVAAGIVRDLLPKGLASADEVFLAGSSAGGLGVMNLVDDLHALLPAGLRLVAIADAAFGIDYPDFDPATGVETTLVPTPRELDFVAAVTLWGGRGDASCELLATTPLQHAACRTPPPLLMNHQVDVPVFIRQSEKDQVQLKMLGADLMTTTPAAAAYRERFSASMRLQVAALPSPVSAFATYDTRHGTFDTSLFATDTVDGVSMRSAIGNFYRSPCTQALHVEQP